MKRKRYTPAQKAAIVLEVLKEEETLPQIASRHGVHPNLLRKWKAQYGITGQSIGILDSLKRRCKTSPSHPAGVPRIVAKLTGR